MGNTAGRAGGRVAHRRGLQPTSKGKRTGSQRADDGGAARRDLAERVHGSGGVSAGAGDGGAQDYFHGEEIFRAARLAGKERAIAGGIGKRGPFRYRRSQQGRLRFGRSELRDDGGRGLAAADSKSGAGRRVRQGRIRGAAENLRKSQRSAAAGRDSAARLGSRGSCAGTGAQPKRAGAKTAW